MSRCISLGHHGSETVGAVSKVAAASSQLGSEVLVTFALHGL
jgi:hypothetical protein